MHDSEETSEETGEAPAGGVELAGGNSTRVTRIGDTVRREAGPWTPAVHAYLTALRAAGITEVPEPLAYDGETETVSFVPGVAANYPMPDWVWTDEVLTDAARLLRRIHDASAPLVAASGAGPLDSPWRLASHKPAEVICHNDFAPYNLVFEVTDAADAAASARLTGVIDFDTASPGPRIWDLAYLAYRLVPYVDDADGPTLTAAGRAARLQRLLDAYGMPFESRRVLAVMADRLVELADFTDERAAATARPEFLAHAAMYRADAGRLRP